MDQEGVSFVEDESPSEQGPWGRALIRLLGSLRLTLLLLFALGALSALGTLVPQGGDFPSFQRFVAGSVSRFFVSSGLTELFTDAWYFRALLLVFVVNLIFCSLLRLPRVWREFRKPAFPRNTGFFDRGRHRALKPLPRKVEGLDRALARIGFTFFADEAREGGRIRLYRRQAWASFGAYVCHLGIVLLVLGGLVGSRWGAEGMARGREGEILSVYPPAYYRLLKEYRSAAFRLDFYRDLARLEILRPGDMQRGEALMKRMGDLERQMGLLEERPVFRARVLSAREEWDPDRSGPSTVSSTAPSIANWVTEVELLAADGSALEHRSIRVNQPLEHEDWRLYQADFGHEPAREASMGRTLIGSAPGRIPLSADETLEILAYYPDFVVSMGADGKRSYGTRGADPQNPAVLVKLLRDGEEEGAPRLLFRDHEGHEAGGEGGPRFSGVEADGRLRFVVATSDGSSRRGTSFTGLSLSYDPGTPLVWGGALLMVLGMAWAFYFRADSLWIWLPDEGEARLRVSSHKGTMGEEWALARIEGLHLSQGDGEKVDHGTR